MAALAAGTGSGSTPTSRVDGRRLPPPTARPHQWRTTGRPTRSRPIVLIHGPLADNPSGSTVGGRLQRQGRHVLAPSLPLREPASDAACIRSVLDGVPGPIVLLGRSYGAAVISQAAAELPRVQARPTYNRLAPGIGKARGLLIARPPSPVWCRTPRRPADRHLRHRGAVNWRTARTVRHMTDGTGGRGPESGCRRQSTPLSCQGLPTCPLRAPQPGRRVPSSAPTLEKERPQ
ncbi:alpha/beta fold hydrolase [Streptomyces gilvus]|uniref:alpha/beta fold hydrolase n=1 Tax=Streptomyces gilvus TaxID=2920937 RepID=UPI0035A8A96B